MNKLVHIDEFRRVLANYRPSPTSLHALSQTKLVMLTAPTSAGRNTIIRYLMTTGDYYFIVSDTTRKKRMNDGVMEQDGHEYWFRQEEEVLSDLENGKYLEAAIIHEQQVSGISIRELERATEAGKIAITDAEIAGAANTIALKNDTITLFVLPSSFDEWQRRLKHRGAMDPEEYKRRMQSAVSEFEAALEHEYYTFVVNDTVENAAEQITQIAKLDIVDAEYQQQARALAEQLLISTRTLVQSL